MLVDASIVKVPQIMLVDASIVEVPQIMLVDASIVKVTQIMLVDASIVKVPQIMLVDAKHCQSNSNNTNSDRSHVALTRLVPCGLRLVCVCQWISKTIFETSHIR